MAVELVAEYFATDTLQAPQAADRFTLSGMAIRTFNLRTVVDSLELEIDSDGFARGYAIISAAEGEAVLHGDYFLLDMAENFASGSRLVNIDPTSPTQELCNGFAIRFLESASSFDSGTELIIWTNDAGPSVGPSFSYTAYDQAGTMLLSSSFEGSDVAFRVSANELKAPLEVEFGALDIRFPAGIVGHVSGVMSAFGRFSVGYEATCLDPD